MKNTLLIILAVLIVGTASTVQATENNEAQKLSRKELKQQQISEALDIIKSGQFVIARNFNGSSRTKTDTDRRQTRDDYRLYNPEYNFERQFVYSDVLSRGRTTAYHQLLMIDLSNNAQKCDTTYFDQKTNTYIFKYSKNIDSETYYFTVKINKKGRVNVYYDDPQGNHIRALEPSDYLGVIPLESKS